ncbi:MAG: hypothetical protein FWC23_04210 [Chitinispirillia bacterium]|nr:hypothetical protein [Chitinispirillia bacterium]MCL2268371.1 hypothetical protein [Chitinispirillia bacterium]
MRYRNAVLFAAIGFAALLLASCTQVDFNNPLDPKGNNYLYGDPRCEAEKIADSEEGAGLFTNPKLTPEKGEPECEE